MVKVSLSPVLTFMYVLSSLVVSAMNMYSTYENTVHNTDLLSDYNKQNNELP